MFCVTLCYSFIAKMNLARAWHMHTFVCFVRTKTDGCRYIIIVIHHIIIMAVY